MGIQSNSTIATAILTIDLDALQHNYKCLEKFRQTECAAVIKANAYGLGMAEIHNCLKKQGCTTFFVATLQEGIELRQLDGQSKIYILNGLHQNAEKYFIKYFLSPVLKSVQELEKWIYLCHSDNRNYPAAVHIETGINRFGIPIDELSDAVIESAKKSIKDLLIMSHLACADDETNPSNNKQLNAFCAFKKRYPELRYSLCNSAAFMLSEAYNFDIARLGIALYGVNPFKNGHCVLQEELRCVASLHCPIAQIKIIKKHESVGYGNTWTAKEDTPIAIIAAGYADGISLCASNKATLSIKGYPLPILGRVSMDMTVLSLVDVPQKYWKCGELVEVFGQYNAIENYAKASSSHAHEVLTRIGKRIIRHYVT